MVFQGVSGPPTLHLDSLMYSEHLLLIDYRLKGDTVKSVFSGHSNRTTKFKTVYRLMLVKSPSRNWKFTISKLKSSRLSQNLEETDLSSGFPTK